MEWGYFACYVLSTLTHAQVSRVQSGLILSSVFSCLVHEARELHRLCLCGESVIWQL